MKKNPFLVSLLQALGLASYIAIVSTVMLNAETWFGNMNRGILGPVAFLLLFVVSALVSGSIVLGYPAHLFFVQKKHKEAVRNIITTTAILVLFALAIFAAIALF